MLPEWIRKISVAAASPESWPPKSGAAYNWEEPTQDAYHETDDDFVGNFESARRALDYSYHKKPATERQILQDAILQNVVREDHEDREEQPDTQPPASPPRPWLVFTAGPMGAGKSYVLSKLHSTGRFPLGSFLKIDPDMLKSELPEYPGYLRANPETAATLLHGESSQMADVLFHHALVASRSMLVDGSLRNIDWHKTLITDTIRAKYPQYRIAIIHVTARPETVRNRERQRAEKSGRAVPESLLEESIAQSPKSVAGLSPLVDASFTITNNTHEPMTLTRYIPSGDLPSTWRAFTATWSNVAPTADCESPVLCEMEAESTRAEEVRAARELWGRRYPHFCAGCAVAFDATCGVCEHGGNVCACEVCGPKYRAHGGQGAMPVAGEVDS